MNRDKQRQQERRLAALEWASKQETAYCSFVHIKDVNLTGQPILLANRVSTSKQQKDLPAQILFNYQTAREAGANVIGCFTSVSKGYCTDTHQQIAELAQEKQVKAILWETVCRAIRHPDWCRYNLLAQPTEGDLIQFANLFPGIQLVTVLNPAATSEDVWKHQSSRGTDYNPFSRNTKGSTLRNKLYWQVTTMWLNGYSAKQIHRTLGVKERTVYGWVEPFLAR